MDILTINITTQHQLLSVFSCITIERASSYPTNLTYVSNWLLYDHGHKPVVVPHVGTRHPALRHLLSPPAPLSFCSSRNQGHWHRESKIVQCRMRMTPSLIVRWL